MAAPIVNVVSYNMSVFSAMLSLGAPVPGYASEARFLSRPYSNGFFNQAVDHLATIVKQHDVGVIGIQEYHPPTLAHIQAKLNPINPNFIYVDFILPITNNAKVLTIYNGNLFGPMVYKYEADLGLTVRGDGTNIFNPPAAGGVPPNDGGRPILIVLTQSGYTLVNFHGPNRPRITAAPVDVANLLREALPIHLALARAQFGGNIDFGKIIITCDSNDRAHRINMNDPLVLNGFNYHDGNPAANPALSCCYNYDSSQAGYAPGFVAPPPGPPASMGLLGAENQYAYSGDYILATKLAIPVTVVPSQLDQQPADLGASINSDHALVIAAVEIDTSPFVAQPIAGGRRRHRRGCRKTCKKHRKSRARSRRYKK